MAIIVIAVLPQMGHVGPTLEIAASLVKLGHRIVYLTSEAFRLPIEGIGAELFTHPAKRGAQFDSAFTEAATQDVKLRPGVDAWNVSEAVEQVKANLLLVDRMLVEYHLRMEPLVSVRRLIFSTSLLNWQEPPDIPQDEPLLILCPELLELPKFRYPRKRLFYAEPAITPKSRTNDIQMGAPDKPLVLCAFGTQSLRHTRLAEHYQMVFALAQQNKGCDFLLAAEYLQLLPNSRPPANLQVASIVSQRFLLSSCAAFVTHGGLGSIKEAILAGVPTVVLPSFGDQFFNAMRVRYHGIGEGLFEDRQTVTEVSRVLAAMLEGRFQEKVAHMQAHFSARSRARLSVLLIEEALVNA